VATAETDPIDETHVPAEKRETRPAYEVGQEIRFAVVMYGGVALAIYMNGIAQELLRLVQATAARTSTSGAEEARLADEELHDSAVVYRKIAMRLSRQSPTGEPSSRTIWTRFVVDTISGTSAGGINGMFLAKALANDQSIDELQRLWIEEGDIEKLVNDEESLDGTDLKQREPASLLSGDRMYVKLLQAFSGMDETAKGGRDAGKPLVDGVNLYVTTTDIRGLVVPLRLEDEVVQERRYKHVFHFIDGRDVQGGVRHDFAAEHNGFLAYAARCTSSFPFAFEPMRLDAAELLAPTVKGRAGSLAVQAAGYTRFFQDHVRTSPDDPVASYRTRSFGDGGYLDNKPFGYAIEALSLRADLLPSERRLIYVEPTPEHITADGPGRRVDVIENVTAALFTLPTYETIREDLQRLLERNRMVDRIGRLTADLDEDVKAFGANAKPLPTVDWRALSLNDLIARFGVAYGAYHRLKVAAATDELATLTTEAIGLDPDSDDRLAIRYLIGEWRLMTYAANPRSENGAAPLKTENEFLLQFGLGYRFRRLGFVRSKIDLLSCLDNQAERLLEAAGVAPVTAAEAPAFVTELLRLKRAFAEIFESLTNARNLLRDPNRSPLTAGIVGIRIGRDDLKEILSRQTDEGRRRAARKRLNAADPEAFHNAVINAEGQLRTILEGAARAAAAALGDTEAMSNGQRSAREAIRGYYEKFENFDLVTFPVRYSTEVGEIDSVGVIRISPDDVENEPKGLAGAGFAHFGGFLKREWRVNDILLGRLHGSERLIHALLPGEEQRSLREALIDEAHARILDAVVLPADRAAVTDRVIQSVAEQADKVTSAAHPASLPDVGRPALEAAIRATLSPYQLLHYFRTAYKCDASLPAQRTARTMSRAARVVGQMLDGLGRDYGTTRTPGVWLARVAGVFWELIEIAVPGSLKRIVYEHWLALIGCCGLLIVITSLVLRAFFATMYSGRVLAIGLVILATPSAFMTMIWLTADVLHGRGRIWRATVVFAVVAVLLLAGWKAMELFESAMTLGGGV
jgi:patatin-related protein